MGTPAARVGQSANLMEPTTTAKADKQAIDDTTNVTVQDLVDAFIQNGSFDAVRQQILESFTASESGHRFTEQTQKLIAEALEEIFNPDSSNNPLRTSPIRAAGGTQRKQKIHSDVFKRLERETAFSRAEDTFKDHMRNATSTLDEDLQALLEKITAQRKPKDAESEAGTRKEGKQNGDVEMKIN